MLFNKALAAGALFVAAAHLYLVERAVYAFGVILAVPYVAGDAVIYHIVHKNTSCDIFCASLCALFAALFGAGIDKTAQNVIIFINKGRNGGAFAAARRIAVKNKK